MDIVKVFMITCENIVMGLVYLKRYLLTNAVCTEHISVLLNVIAAVFRLKIFSVLQMLSTLMHISYFSKIRRLQK